MYIYIYIYTYIYSIYSIYIVIKEATNNIFEVKIYIYIIWTVEEGDF